VSDDAERDSCRGSCDEASKEVGLLPSCLDRFLFACGKGDTARLEDQSAGLKFSLIPAGLTKISLHITGRCVRGPRTVGCSASHHKQ
jgi:hypothetical protein